MYEVLATVIIAITAILIHGAYITWRCYPRKGKFEVSVNSDMLFKFETDLGVFNIDRKHHRLSFSTNVGNGHCSLDDVAAVRFKTSSKYAFLDELFGGFDILDLLGVYRDTIDYFAIWIETKDGMRMPVFVASQYTPREFLMGWYYELQKLILTRLRLYFNGFEYSRLVYRKIWEAFEESGTDVAAR